MIGAGVAGLTCARALLREGVDVTVYEASDGVGGRVCSDELDGFTLDRGFQVLFTAYPAAARQLDFDALNLRRFEPGALIAQGSTFHKLADPARDPGALIASALSNLVTLSDKLKVWQLSAELGSKPISALLDGPDQTTDRYLRRRGFSDRFLDNFARPFFGGIFLDRSLQTSARAFQFVWKMLTDGETVVPAGGMGEISRQLADQLLSEDRIRLGARVESLSDVKADTIVVATAAPETARLTGNPVPGGALGSTTVYFEGDVPLWSGGKLLLNANARPFVNQATMLTNTAPEYAPPGKHLVAACVLGVPEMTDEGLIDAAHADLTRMLTADRAAQNALRGYRFLRAYRIPFAQFPQPAGIYGTLPASRTTLPGVFLAGEMTAASSLNAAIRSGEECAEEILR